MREPRPRSRILAPLAAAGAALALGLGYAVYSGFLNLLGPDAVRYPVRGIDVSHHQGRIDWDLLPGEGVQFAYIKASEGGDYQDRRFSENWTGARRSGLRAGAYHFFTFCRDGAAQADNFLDALGDAPSSMLAPGIDLEFRGNCSERPSPQELRGELVEFSARVERKLGLAPLYYVTPDFLRAYEDALPTRSEIWIRSFFFRPERSWGRRWTFWQYAGRGRMKGIAGPVDLDVFAGSAAEWKEYLARRSRTGPADPVQK